LRGRTYNEPKRIRGVSIARQSRNRAQRGQKKEEGREPSNQEWLHAFDNLSLTVIAATFEDEPRMASCHSVRDEKKKKKKGVAGGVGSSLDPTPITNVLHVASTCLKIIKN
jgi:hypothetical protein